MLGNRFPAIENNIELIAVLIVAISVIPIGFEVLKARRERRTLAEAVEDTLAPDADPPRAPGVSPAVRAPPPPGGAAGARGG